MITDKVQYHGHEVINLMLASGELYSRESLLDSIAHWFGEDARFFICTREGMTATELIDELWKKGKFHGTLDAFTFDSGKRCNH